MVTGFYWRRLAANDGKWLQEQAIVPECTEKPIYLQGMLITGARPNELAGLRWDDVDFQWGSLKIHDKVEGERTIPLMPMWVALLHTMLDTLTHGFQYTALDGYGRKKAENRLNASSFGLVYTSLSSFLVHHTEKWTKLGPSCLQFLNLEEAGLPELYEEALLVLIAVD